jgi:hypothetical protein
MQTLDIHMPAGPHTLFTEETARSIIGQSFVAKSEDNILGTGKVVDAHVVEDGRALRLKVEWPEKEDVAEKDT